MLNYIMTKYYVKNINDYNHSISIQDSIVNHSHLKVDFDLLNVIKKYLYIISSNKNGNHVVQKCIEYYPYEFLLFMITRINDKIVTFTNNIYSCRIILRIIEHFPYDKIKGMIDNIVKFIRRIYLNNYGKYVIEHVINYCDEETRELITREVMTLINVKYILNPNLLNIYGMILLHCNSDMKKDILDNYVFNIDKIHKALRKYNRRFFLKITSKISEDIDYNNYNIKEEYFSYKEDYIID